MQESSYEQQKQQLIEEITCVFDGVSRDGGVSLNEAWVIDDYGNDEERAKAREKDTETRWQDVPEEGIAYGASCLSFFDEIGFRYYIPAYIVWYLRYMDDEDPDSLSCDSNTFDFLIYALTLDDNKDLKEFRLSRFKHFTEEESKSIAHFLEFIQEKELEYLLEVKESLIEGEVQRLQGFLKQPISQQQLEACYRQAKKNVQKRGSLSTDAGRALERYWKQFL